MVVPAVYAWRQFWSKQMVWLPFLTWYPSSSPSPNWFQLSHGACWSSFLNFHPLSVSVCLCPSLCLRLEWWADRREGEAGCESGPICPDTWRCSGGREVSNNTGGGQGDGADRVLWGWAERGWEKIKGWWRNVEKRATSLPPPEKCIFHRCLPWSSFDKLSNNTLYVFRSSIFNSLFIALSNIAEI